MDGSGTKCLVIMPGGEEYPSFEKLFRCLGARGPEMYKLYQDANSGLFVFLITTNNEDSGLNFPDDEYSINGAVSDMLGKLIETLYETFFNADKAIFKISLPNLEEYLILWHSHHNLEHIKESLDRLAAKIGADDELKGKIDKLCEVFFKKPNPYLAQTVSYSLGEDKTLGIKKLIGKELPELVENESPDRGDCEKFLGELYVASSYDKYIDVLMDFYMDIFSKYHSGTESTSIEELTKYLSEVKSIQTRLGKHGSLIVNNLEEILGVENEHLKEKLPSLSHNIAEALTLLLNKRDGVLNS